MTRFASNTSGMSTAQCDDGEFVFNVELKKQDDRWLVLTSRGVDRKGSVWSVRVTGYPTMMAQNYELSRIRRSSAFPTLGNRFI